MPITTVIYGRTMRKAHRIRKQRAALRSAQPAAPASDKGLKPIASTPPAAPVSDKGLKPIASEAATTPPEKPTKTSGRKTASAKGPDKSPDKGLKPRLNKLNTARIFDNGLKSIAWESLAATLGQGA